MYLQKDKTNALKSAQRLLSGIPGFYRVVPNGVFDKKTEDSVIKFKESVGLDSDGIINRETLNTLFSERLSAARTEYIRSIPIYDKMRGAALGNTGSSIASLNAMLNTLLLRYGRRGVRPSVAYTAETARGIYEMYCVYRLSPGASLTDELLYRMITDYAEG